MKKAVYILLVAAAVSTLVSCNDNFMERQPKTEIGEESFFKTEKDLKMYCFGLIDASSYGYNQDGGTDLQATTDNVEVKNIMISKNPTSTTIGDGWTWKRLYDINYLLENVGRANVPNNVKANYEGIGRYYRAKFYMEKVKRFSDVPWYDKVLSSDDPDMYKKRDHRDSVVKHIFEDYEYAVQHVYEDQEQGNVDKWIVLAMMARHALYEGTYRKYHPELNLQATANIFLHKAADASKMIMDKGHFKLYNTGKPQEDYATLFNSLDLSSNPEIIEAHYYDKNVADNGMWGAYMFGNHSVFPTKKLVQTYLMADGTYYDEQPGWETKLFIEEFNYRDPRMYQTLAYPGWVLKSTMQYASGQGIYVQSLNRNFSGYHQIKGFPNSSDENYYKGIDYPCIRYAEVLLTFAEAKAELGELDQQVLDETINLIRDRAGMPHLSMGAKADPYMQRQFPDIGAELLEIRRERSVELVFEGLRFDDLMRWHAGMLLEKIPEGLYFPSLGKYDLTGDGVSDIILIPSFEEIPAEANKEKNSNGVSLVYYRTGTIDDPDATVYLKNGSGGSIVTAKTMGTFTEPRDYYRPVPRHEVDLNKNLLPQLFGWTD